MLTLRRCFSFKFTKEKGPPNDEYEPSIKEFAERFQNMFVHYGEKQHKMELPMK